LVVFELFPFELLVEDQFFLSFFLIEDPFSNHHSIVQLLDWVLVCVDVVVSVSIAPNSVESYVDSYVLSWWHRSGLYLVDGGCSDHEALHFEYVPPSWKW